MSSKVSIVVPVYNSEKYISRCIQSIIKQTYTNIEILIIDDESKDKSLEIIKELSELDNRVIYISQKNSGPSMARNEGIDKSTGEYLMFVDSDDTLDKYYVEYMVNEITSMGKDMVCCGYKDISRYGVYDITDFRNFNNTNKIDFMKKVCTGTGGVLWGKIFKKEIINRYNIRLNKDIFMCEDLIFVLEYSLKCNSFGIIDKYLYRYNRLNESSISSNISINYIENYLRVFKEIERLLVNADISKDEVNNIIIKRTQDIVLSIIDLHSKKLTKIGLRKSEQDINYLLSIKYISEKKDKFETNSKLDYIYIFLIKKGKLKSLIIYAYIINLLKYINIKIKHKKNIEIEDI